MMHSPRYSFHEEMLRSVASILTIMAGILNIMAAFAMVTSPLAIINILIASLMLVCPFVIYLDSPTLLGYKRVWDHPYFWLTPHQQVEHTISELLLNNTRLPHWWRHI